MARHTIAIFDSSIKYLFKTFSQINEKTMRAQVSLENVPICVYLRKKKMMTMTIVAKVIPPAAAPPTISGTLTPVSGNK